ncbi:hypothetical protein ACWD62_36795 [Streptomyces sp. NPDC005146]
MTTEIGSLTGVRQAITVVIPVRLPSPPSWADGPIPFELGSRRTDAETRQTYFTPAAARGLYGTRERPRRWHRFTDITHGPLHLHGMELLRTVTAQDQQYALAVLHFTVEGPVLLDVLRAIGYRHTAGVDPLDGPLAPGKLLAGVAEPRGAEAPFALARPYTVAFLTPDDTHTPALRSDGRLPDTADSWLWSLASRSDETDFPTTSEQLRDQTEHIVRVSADWSALVLRHGAAFRRVCELGLNAHAAPPCFRICALSRKLTLAIRNLHRAAPLSPLSPQERMRRGRHLAVPARSIVQVRPPRDRPSPSFEGWRRGVVLGSGPTA